MGIVEEYSELSKWYQKEKALNRELHTENNKLQAEVERLKELVTDRTNDVLHYDKENQRLREALEAIADDSLSRVGMVALAKKWAELEGEDDDFRG